MLLNIAIAQLRPKKGDYAANIARLGEVFAQLGALDPQPDVLVLAETALTGYFLEGGVRDAARTAGQVFADLQAAYLATRGSDAPPLDVVAGFDRSRKCLGKHRQALGHMMGPMMNRERTHEEQHTAEPLTVKVIVQPLRHFAKLGSRREVLDHHAHDGVAGVHARRPFAIAGRQRQVDALHREQGK